MVVCIVGASIIIVIMIMITFYAMMKVSSRCSRLEEKLIF